MLFAPLKSMLATLRFRLMAWVTLVVLVIVVVSMIAVRQVVGRRLEAEFDQHLLEDQGIVERLLADSSLDDKTASTLARLGEVHAHRGWFVQVRSLEGKILWSSPQTPALAIPPPVGERRFVDVDTYRLVQAPISNGLYSGFLTVGVSREAIEDDLSLVNRIMVLAGVMILVLAPVVGFFLASRATRPLTWIIDTTARLQPAHLEERLPVRGGGDELSQLSRTINGMLDRIASYIDRHRDFIASAAHELRSPLAAIRSSVEVALNKPRSAEEYANLLADVVEECGRLSGLVDRLLLLAESDAGRLPAGTGHTRLDKIVRESVDMFQAVAETKGVELQVNDPLPALAVRGDDHHLRQIVRNLVDNALKFTAAGIIKVDLSADAGAKQAVLRVTDTGPGIDPEDVPKIFNRFFRGDKARQREEGPGGIGLGLSICQALVEALGGTITVESAVGKGSCFTVRLAVVG